MTTINQKFIRTAPRKIRLVLSAMRGLNLDRAISLTQFMPGQAAKDVHTSLVAAKGSATDKGLSADGLTVLEAKCDEGPRLKRRIMHSKGRARGINKQMSHIQITVGAKLINEAKKEG